jgi:hypothetical protein
MQIQPAKAARLICDIIHQLCFHLIFTSQIAIKKMADTTYYGPPFVFIRITKEETVDQPFDRLTVLSRVEGPSTLSQPVESLPSRASGSNDRVERVEGQI